jgi:hypothetical protein
VKNLLLFDFPKMKLVLNKNDVLSIIFHASPLHPSQPDFFFSVSFILSISLQILFCILYIKEWHFHNSRYFS